MDHGDPSFADLSARLPQPRQRYVLVFTHAETMERVTLCTATSSNAATVEFHHQLALMRGRSWVGELMVIRQDTDEAPVLRQPIGRRRAPLRAFRE